jgi:hypothetical protein
LISFDKILNSHVVFTAGVHSDQQHCAHRRRCPRALQVRALLLPNPTHRIILHALQIIFFLRRLKCIAELSPRPQRARRKGATLDISYRCQQLRQVAALLEAIRTPPPSDFSLFINFN